MFIFYVIYLFLLYSVWFMYSNGISWLDIDMFVLEIFFLVNLNKMVELCIFDMVVDEENWIWVVFSDGFYVKVYDVNDFKLVDLFYYLFYF